MLYFIPNIKLKVYFYETLSRRAKDERTTAGENLFRCGFFGVVGAEIGEVAL